MKKYNLKFSISIVLAFIIFTIIGTLSHEFGHIIVAKYLGYETTLNYGSMTYVAKGFNEDKNVIEANTIFEEFKSEIQNNEAFVKKDRLKELREIITNKFPYKKEHSFLVSLGGPIQTILTSFLGLLVLGFRASKNKTTFQFLDWIAVFLALFILREVFNFITTIINVLFFNKSNFYGDEFKISRYLEYNQWFIPIMAFVLGLAISLYVIFKIIPFKYRFPFIVSGFVGGCLGFAIWFGFLGRLLFVLD